MADHPTPDNAVATHATEVVARLEAAVAAGHDDLLGTAVVADLRHGIPGSPEPPD